MKVKRGVYLVSYIAAQDFGATYSHMTFNVSSRVDSSVFIDEIMNGITEKGKKPTILSISKLT